MRSLLLLSTAALLFGACGDDDVTDTTPTDAAMSVEDGGVVEGDAGEPGADAGEATDGGGTIDDGGTLPDAAPRVDAGPSPCDGQIIGTTCRRNCADGYECVDGRCRPPATREGCGGFAAAMCTTRAFPNCTYYVSADYGPCLSEAERACACAEHGDLFACR